jgi:hypothetical protein
MELCAHTHALRRWTGKCWYIHNMIKYEFDLEFEVSNPSAAVLLCRHSRSAVCCRSRFHIPPLRSKLCCRNWMVGFSIDTSHLTIDLARPSPPLSSLRAQAKQLKCTAAAKSVCLRTSNRSGLSPYLSRLFLHFSWHVCVYDRARNVPAFGIAHALALGVRVLCSPLPIPRLIARVCVL